jgi:membrane-associated phospholipid phosphatase
MARAAQERLAFVTAFGWVWVGAHWPSQTLGGLLAAIALIGLLNHALARFERRLKAMPERH